MWFSLTFPWLFQSVQNSLTFPWLENAFPFSRFSSFSSPSGNPDYVLKAYNHQKGTRIFILKRNRINVMFMGYSLFLSKRILKYSASNVLKGNSDNFLSETKIYNKTELFIPEATIAVLMILHQRVFVTLCSNNTEIWQVFMYLFHLHSTILQKSTVDKWWFSHKLYPFGHIMFPIFLGKTNWNK